MDEDDRQQADARTVAAFEALALRDPRDQFREWLRALRDADPSGFADAREYYEQTLLSTLADSQADPVLAWIAYGLQLAERSDGPGAAVEIDGDGRSRPVSQHSSDALVLFLPEDPMRRARILSLPKRPTAAQRATCDLLALGKTALR